MPLPQCLIWQLLTKQQPLMMAPVPAKAMNQMRPWKSGWGVIARRQCLEQGLSVSSTARLPARAHLVLALHRKAVTLVTVVLVLRPLPTAGSYLWHCEDETDGRKERPPALLVPPTVLTQPRIRRITHQITGMRQLPTKLLLVVE